MPVAGATTYWVARSPSHSNALAGSFVSGTSLVDTDVSNGTSYSYFVQACEPACGTSAFCSYASAYSNPATPTALDCPAGFSTCGACPSGYHPTRYDCSSLCGDCAYGGTNQTDCQSICGSYFSTCGSCPSGYHPTRYDCSSLCGDCAYGGTNQTDCQSNCGSYFSTCGSYPSGYHPTRYDCSSLCGDCAYGGTNQTTCVIN
jgi:hypothetical protein